MVDMWGALILRGLWSHVSWYPLDGVDCSPFSLPSIFKLHNILYRPDLDPDSGSIMGLLVYYVYWRKSN
jgi:hypothetical protein